MAVYFIQAGLGGPVKIGTAKYPDQRLRNLQTGNSQELKMLRTMPGGKATERWLHEEFKADRMRSEWFIFSSKMLEISPPDLADLPTRRNKEQKEQSMLHSAGINLNDLARELGVTIQAVSQWRKVPAERCLAVEEATGISRYELRPDIFGQAPESAAS